MATWPAHGSTNWDNGLKEYIDEAVASVEPPEEGSAVDSVNGQIGAVVLDAEDVGAKPASYAPAWSEVTGKPAVIAAGADQAAARGAIGAGTSSLALGTTGTTAKAGNYAPAWSEVTSKPAVIAAGADQAAARTAIGAGTSSLAIGTTGSTAMAGNKTAADLGGVVGTGISQIVALTQAEYDALGTKVATTLYAIKAS